MTKIYNFAWKGARLQVGLPHLRVHDLKHTFRRRLGAVGAPLNTRKVLLGHTTGDITSHYSAAEFDNALSKVCEGNSGKTPAITLLRRKAPQAAWAEARR